MDDPMMPAPTPQSSASQIPLDAKVAFLRQPPSFPEPTYRVEAIETHMSWVFLTNGYAYKLKKPVYHDFLDFRSVEARRYYCEEEVRLNRRLASDVYLGTVALSIAAADHLQFGEHGTVIDWLVKMRRLPLHNMLDYAIRNGTASAEDMCRIGTRLSTFYRECTPVAIEAPAYQAAFLHGIERNLQELGHPAYRLPLESIRDLCRRQRDVLNDHRDLFDARVHAGRIVEGHGDLRPEHICLLSDVAVIDCLEFSRELRIVDPVDELAFLALECERLGAAELGALPLRIYCEASGDRPAAALAHFYQSYRATLRARIAIKHLDEEKFRYSEEWRRRAVEYLHLAQRHQESISATIEPPP